MCKKRIIALALCLAFLFASCGQKSNSLTVGYGDIEPPHYTNESELVMYLGDIDSEDSIDCYYKPIVVPDDLTFAYIRPQNIYICWNYNYSNSNASYPYFTWTAETNGQERLDFSINNEKLSRIKDTYYYYSIVKSSDWPDISAICTVEWVVDGYNFRINIPSKFILKENKLDIDEIKKYTQLEKVII